MKENPNIILTFLSEGISRIKLNDPSNYNALSSKNIKSLIDGLDIKGTVLIITENTDHNVIKSARNLHGVEVIPASLLNALDISMRENILTTKNVIKKIDSIWGEG